MRLTPLVLMSLLATACGPGETGPAGPAGPQGPQGETGATLNKTYVCTGTANNGTANVALIHTVYTFSDGSVTATCNVADGALWVTGINMWRGGQPEAAGAQCILAADIDSTKNGGIWTMETNTQRTSSSATYRNTGSPLDGRVFALTCTAS
ncbi:collagen-like protein [Melittangium boletus]|uniref:Uncharacterized protein n=1 Tax=Melittangium boletus DSM 14713 TaxID=1294270 RepID=A0A250IC42_9BACT|nr:collagen-like protein [Melittangium boletus]ATB28707.1 hypothetical protein MEBOL_002156 [Melittangium boletus DSM 14713]